MKSPDRALQRVVAHDALRPAEVASGVWKERWRPGLRYRVAELGPYTIAHGPPVNEGQQVLRYGIRRFQSLLQH